MTGLSSNTIYLKNTNVFQRLHILAELMKYRLSLAVSFSAATGYFLFTNKVDNDFFFMAAGVFLLSSGSVALNQVTERESDSVMERTRNRPLPAGKISPASAIMISILLLFSGSCLLGVTGLLSCVLGVICVVFYNAVYTPLKRITSLAILPGAVVGAIPPMIGFVSAGGSVLSTAIIVFSTIMFMWQLPHFWLLLLRYRDQYEQAGFKTIAAFMSDKQIKHLTWFWSLLSSVLLVVFILIVNRTTDTLAKSLIVLNFFFILLFSRLILPERDVRDTWRAFILLNSFGLVIMSVLIADSLLKGS